MIRPVLFLLTVLIALAGCKEEPAPTNPTRSAPVDIPFRSDGTLTFERPDGEGIVEIAIEIAEGDSATQRGMMQRTSMPDRSGMLFLMPRVERHGFWMANTPLSLDITFVTPDSTVINTAKCTVPYSTESVYADAPSRFIVETVCGFTDRWGIVAGDRVTWTRGGSDDLSDEPSATAPAAPSE